MHIYTNSAIHFADEIPSFVESSMDALYGSLYATLTHLQLHDATDHTSTYARWHDGQLVSLFLYRQHGPEVRVINEGMTLIAEEIERFCDYIFNQSQSTQRIHFHAIQFNHSIAGHPALSFSCTEDIVIALHATKEDYLRQLGKSTRKNLRQHLAKAERDLPGFRYEIREGHAISEHIIRRIIGFNHARMADKQRASAITGESAARLIRLIHKRGCVGMVYVKDQLCGGSLGCRVGKDLYSLMNAHDPHYNTYSLGNLCRYLMIIHAINNGDQRFHLLGGNFSNKQSMLGQRQRLNNLVLYRSNPALLRHASGIIKLSVHAGSYRLRSWIEDQTQKKRTSFFAHMLTSARQTFRQFKQQCNRVR